MYFANISSAACLWTGTSTSFGTSKLYMARDPVKVRSPQSVSFQSATLPSLSLEFMTEDHFLTRQVLNSISKKVSSIVHYLIWYIHIIYIYIYNLWHLYECTTCWRIFDIFWSNIPLHLGPQNVFDLWHIDVDFFHFWTLPWQHSVQRHFDLGASTSDVGMTLEHTYVCTSACHNNP